MRVKLKHKRPESSGIYDLKISKSGILYRKRPMNYSWLAMNNRRARKKLPVRIISYTQAIRFLRTNGYEVYDWSQPGRSKKR